MTALRLLAVAALVILLAGCIYLLAPQHVPVQQCCKADRWD